MIYYTMEKLCENGSLIVFYWVLDHTSLIRNKKVHLAIRLKAKKRDKQEEHWSLLVYIKKNLMQVQSTELTR